MNDLPVLEPIPQFGGSQQEIRVLRLSESRLFMGIGLIDEDAVLAQGLLDAWHERAMKIAEDNNSAIVVDGEGVLSGYFEVHAPGGDGHSVFHCKGSCRVQVFFGPVAADHGEASSSKEDSVVADSARYVQNWAGPGRSGEKVHVLLQQRSGFERRLDFRHENLRDFK